MRETTWPVVPSLMVLVLVVVLMAFMFYIDNKNAKNVVIDCAARWEGFQTKVITPAERRMCMVNIDGAWRYEKNIQINVTK